MKRILTLEICMLVVLFLPLTANATGGGLRKNSIKTCPNGVTYGTHSDGHGGTHWHVAVTNGTNYYADGKQFIVTHVLVITKMKELLEQQMVAVTLHRVALKTVEQITIIVIIIQVIIYKITVQKKWL